MFSECTVFQFECICGKPRCISVHQFNDGVQDCADGSDDGKWDSDVALSPDYRCPNGETPRNTVLTIPRPPPPAPMVPCGSDYVNLCSKELGETCLVCWIFFHFAVQNITIV